MNQIINHKNDWYLKTETGYKKIIATTDKSLGLSDVGKQGYSTDEFNPILPQPSESFIKEYIESYNKGEVVKDVMVEYDRESVIGANDKPQYTNNHILYVNPKDNTITIKKIKDNWDREEVSILLAELAAEFICDDGIYFNKVVQISDVYKWIKENL